MYVVGPKKLEKWNPTKNSDKLLYKMGDIPATTWAQRFYKWVVEYGSKPEGFVWKWQILVGIYCFFFWYLTRKLRTNTNHFWDIVGYQEDITNQVHMIWVCLKMGHTPKHGDVNKANDENHIK